MATAEPAGKERPGQFGDCFDADACVLDKSCQFYRACLLAEDDES
jgi:hypothetical protein